MNYLETYGTPRTGVQGGEFALKKSNAIEAIDLLSDTNIGILGGDVYLLEKDGYFQPIYDNWYYEDGYNTDKNFPMKSRLYAKNYILNYKELTRDSIRYVLVVDDICGSSHLSG